MDVTANHDVFDHSHAREDVRALESSRQAHARDLVYALAGDRSTGEAHLAFLRPVETAQAVHQRCLAGTVGTDDGEKLIGTYRD